MKINEIDILPNEYSLYSFIKWLPKPAFKWIMKHVHKPHYKQMISVYNEIVRDPNNHDKKPLTILHRAAKTVNIPNHEIEEMFDYIYKDLMHNEQQEIKTDDITEKKPSG